MIKVAVPGVNGRMGQAVVTEVMQSADMDLIVATARAGEQLGSKVANSDVVVTNNISNSDFNVLIDFTLPMGVMEHLAFCREHKIAMVIGTTGFTDEQLVAIKNAAADIPIVLSSNMSVGVNICFKLLASASKMLSDQNWQMGIIDLHHEHKKDSPSGTAKQMARILADNSHTSLTDIEMVSHRKGEIAGTHIVSFKSPHEIITIAHETQDRSIFAQGAILAARWVVQQKPGLYSMLDVIG